MTTSMMLLVLLGVPLSAAGILAFVGDRKFAAEINNLGSAATLAAGAGLALEVYLQGPMLAGGRFFFVDAFNIYLSVLTSFVSMTTAIFSRGYMSREREHGRVGTVRMRFYHAMFQLFIFATLLCLLTNNVGVLWIAMELATLCDGPARLAVSHADGDRSGVEIFHPLRRRHPLTPQTTGTAIPSADVTALAQQKARQMMDEFLKAQEQRPARVSGRRPPRRRPRQGAPPVEPATPSDP